MKQNKNLLLLEVNIMNKYTIKNFVEFMTEWLEPLPRTMLDGAIYFGASYIIITLIGGLVMAIDLKLKGRKISA